MPGTPSKIFELEIAPLLPKAAQGIPGQQIAPRIKELFDPQRWPALASQTLVPLGLRWRVTPDMGLPRAPFAVWRRDRRRGDPADVKFTPAEVGGFNVGGGAHHLPTAPLYVLIISITNPSTTSALTVQALDDAHHPLLLQLVQVPAGASRTVRFQHPFIGGFACQGSFVIRSVVGVTMQGMIDRKDEWELIEIAGLPARGGELAGYGGALQGYPSQLSDPPAAARNRVALAQQFYLPLPTSLPSGVTVPEWQIPKPDEAVAELRGGAPSLIERLDAMLQAVDARAASSQGDYRADVTMPGIRQPQSPSKATADATMSVPLLATVLLNAVTDPWFALASGFGATDFPEFLAANEKFLEPATYFHASHDYMVSSEFLFRLFDTFELKAEHCALSHRSVFPPIAPGNLAAALFAQNRPPGRDDPYSAEVALTWAKINRLQIQGNAVAVAEDGLAGAYLNPLRPAEHADKPALFVPAKPGETSDPELHTKNRFIHHQTPLPFAGARTNHYGVASMDAFGRWSGWGVADQALAARAPEAPRLSGLALTPDRSRIAGRTAPHELAVEVVWDWQDRSPQRFELAAVFHRRRYLPDGTRDSGQIPPNDYPASFQTDNAVAGGALIELVFPAGAPGGAPPFDAAPECADPRVSVELLPQATSAGGQNVEGEMRRYRVRVRDLRVTFAPDEEWYFTLFVKGAEWRNPARLSDSAPPLAPGRPPRLTAYVPNPIPAPPPAFTPATILWAALPDAAGTARYRLAFDPIPGATGGYAMFGAYEAKLRDAAGLAVRDDGDLVGRATDLRDLAMPLDVCLDAFARLNATLIPPPAAGAQVEYEVELPGALDGILALAVASVTREQEVSALSRPWLFVAVPRRAVPGVPTLALAQQGGSARLTCSFPRAPKPARVEILRARRELAAREAGTMGPPLRASLEPDWQPLDAAGLPATSADATAAFRFSFDDPTPPSWFPYYYRAVAVGARDDAIGLLPARSPQSNLVRAERLPATLPEIADAAGAQADTQTVRLSFQSDALIELTPRGGFRLDVFAWDAAQSRFADTPALSLALPAASPRPSGGLARGALYYSDVDSAGRRTFEALLDVSGDAYMFRVRLTDPLNRSAERIVSGTIVRDDPPNLSSLSVSRQARDLLVFFASTTTTDPPRAGAYRLEIGFAQAPSKVAQLLLARALHEIAVGSLAKLRLSPATTILRAPQADPGAPNDYGAIVKSFFPASPLQPPRHGRLIVVLTAPDGTAARQEVTI